MSGVARVTVAVLLTSPGMAWAQYDAMRIADRIGALEPRAAQIVALQMSGAIIQRYRELFPYSDRLDDKSWNIVLDRLVDFSRRTVGQAQTAVRGKEKVMREALVDGLTQQKPEDLAALVRYLESDAGAGWLRANAQFERDLLRALVISTAYTITAPRRTEAAYEAVGNRSLMPEQTSPLLIIDVLAGSPRSTPQAFFVWTNLRLVATLEPSLARPIADAQGALAAGMRGGLSHEAYSGLASAFSGSLRTGLEGVDPIAAWDRELASAMEVQIGDLATRAHEVRNPAKSAECTLMFLDAEQVRASGGDYRKLTSGGRPVEPGSISHRSLALAYQRGCQVEQDLVVALQIWTEIAESTTGSSALCTLANWYRVGVGTRPDPGKARLWEERYREETRGKRCARLEIDPRDPLAGMGR